MITGENGEFLKPEIKALKDDVAKLENIRTLFMDAYKQASESFKAQSSRKDAGNGQKNNAEAAISLKNQELLSEFTTNKNPTSNLDVRYSKRYQSVDINSDILSMVERVENGYYKGNEKVVLGTVSDATATEIHRITGVNATGFKVVIEAKQISHILKGHGKNGKSDKSMADPINIAKIEFALEEYDDIRAAGKTKAYTHMVKGKSRAADTILYEKEIGEKSYYVVQAVPNTKAKTLYIVTAFIGKKGYKKETPQLINANSLDVTSEIGSADISIDSISDFITKSQEKLSDRDSAYLSAVESGDMKTTQRLVDEAAKKNGYTQRFTTGRKN